MKFSGGLSSGSSYKYFLGQWQQAALGERIITSSHINYDGLHLCLMVVQWSWYLYRWPTTLVTVSSCTVCLEGYHYHVSPFVMHVNWVLCIKNHWYWCLESIYLNMQLSFSVCLKIDDLGNHVWFLPFFHFGIFISWPVPIRLLTEQRPLSKSRMRRWCALFFLEQGEGHISHIIVCDAPFTGVLLWEEWTHQKMS